MTPTLDENSFGSKDRGVVEMELGQMMSVETLVEAGRVHRSVYLDSRIFDLEMERIFGRGWIYVGHESQIPAPGDYITTSIGEIPVLMSRDQDGKVHVLKNRCAHRGAVVCTRDSGQTKYFRCPYHGWTYGTNGDLVGVPLRKGYPANFDLKATSLRMASAPRVDSYRGFVFASFSQDGETLDSHLGVLKASIDDIVDRAPDGEIALDSGVHKYRYRGNWKLQVENSVDGYHAAFAHESTVGPDGKQFTRRAGEKSGATMYVENAKYIDPNVRLYDHDAVSNRIDSKGVWIFDHGHGYGGPMPDLDDAAKADPVYVAYKTALEARYGKMRTQEILTPTRHNSVIYPNLVIQAMNFHIRVIRPVAVDVTEVDIYPIRFKGAPDEMNRQLVRFLNVTHSASSLIQTDDLEIMERCQRGLEALDTDWIYLNRGLDEDIFDPAANGLKGKGTDELMMRNYYKAWLGYLVEGKT